MSEIGSQFERLVAIMARLRAPGGCPWDRRQTFDSITAYTVEETYEVLQAIADRDWPELTDELGDLLLQIVFYAQMGEEIAAFNIGAVMASLEAKLIRRHPHVFGPEAGALTSAEQVVARWDQIKRQERGAANGGEAPESALGAPPRGLPPLPAAYQMSARAARAGFSWPDAAGVLNKLNEEIAELRQALAAGREEWRDEVGDLLFTAVNVARQLGIEPEGALQAATRKFRRRFIAVEDRLRRQGCALADARPWELEAHWEAVKREESGPAGRTAENEIGGPSAAPVAPSAAAGRLPIRDLRTPQEFQACVDLQRRVWGFDESDLVPVRMFVVARKIGGQVFGAFDGERLAAYCLALPGERAGHLYLHSHMLAVAPEYRDHGLGRRLKWRQREDGLERGFALMEWTFDPLEIKNAYFNVERLGAIARRYVPNQYGITSSVLHAGLPTDRLVAEWWFASDRVRRVLEVGALDGQEIEQRVAVPAQISAWRSAGDPRGAAVQAEIRAQLTAAFASGLAVLRYERQADGGGVFCLGRWNEPLNYGPPRHEGDQGAHGK
jgi:MazG family protein